MSNEIWKFPVGPVGDDPIVLTVPLVATIVAAQYQGDVPCLWIEVEPDLQRENRVFHWRGTGHPFPKEWLYVATFFDPRGPFVWHLFEELVLDWERARGVVADLSGV
jgi:hypothetical protein